MTAQEAEVRPETFFNAGACRGTAYGAEVCLKKSTGMATHVQNHWVLRQKMIYAKMFHSKNGACFIYFIYLFI